MVRHHPSRRLRTKRQRPNLHQRPRVPLGGKQPRERAIVSGAPQRAGRGRARAMELPMGRAAERLPLAQQTGHHRREAQLAVSRSARHPRPSARGPNGECQHWTHAASQSPGGAGCAPHSALARTARLRPPRHSRYQHRLLPGISHLRARTRSARRCIPARLHIFWRRGRRWPYHFERLANPASRNFARRSTPLLFADQSVSLYSPSARNAQKNPGNQRPLRSNLPQRADQRIRHRDPPRWRRVRKPFAPVRTLFDGSATVQLRRGVPFRYIPVSSSRVTVAISLPRTPYLRWISRISTTREFIAARLANL